MAADSSVLAAFVRLISLKQNNLAKLHQKTRCKLSIDKTSEVIVVLVDPICNKNSETLAISRPPGVSGSFVAMSVHKTQRQNSTTEYRTKGRFFCIAYGSICNAHAPHNGLNSNQCTSLNKSDAT